VHKGMAFLTGREIAAHRDTRDWRGKPIEDIFR
jgi:hypothetical protein